MLNRKPSQRYSLLLIFALLGASPPACDGPTTPGSTPGGTGGTVAPTVTATIPSSGAADISITSSLTATFSEPVNPATVTPATFFLTPPVGGTISVTDSTATFSPTGPLSATTAYTATLTTGIQDLTGTPMAAPRTWTFTTGAVPDTTAPTVSGTNPLSGATEVTTSSALTVTFSEPIHAPTITASTFVITPAASGTFSATGTTAMFTPSSLLTPSTLYTVTLNSGIKDLAGNALLAPFSWTFTTGAAPDTTRPTVSATTPTNGATNTSTSSALTAVFSEPVDPLTITAATFTLRNSANVPVTGNITTNGVTVTFALPAGSPLSFGTTYTATLTTGIKDLAGNALLAPFSWTFTTGAAPDTTRPTVSATTPTNGATNVPLTTGLTATFTEPVSASTVNGATFTLRDSASNALSSTVAVSGATVSLTIAPGTPLQYGTTYTATLTTGITDLAGNALQNNFTWTVTTSIAPDTTPPVVSTTSPANAAVGVATSSLVAATLNEAVSPASVSTTTFTLRDSNNSPVNGTVSANGTTITMVLSPGTSLASNRTYTATLTTGIKDLAGNALLAPYSWSFTTTSSSAQTTGLDWPGDGSVRRMLYWHNPFPIYDATYIFKVYPRKKTTGSARYYTTFFWGNDGNFTWDRSNANTFYGAHPYPVPASAGPGQWEISVYGYDFVTGTEVDWNRWHTQAFRAWRETSSITHHEFYYDWPDTSKKISYTVNDPAWAQTNPPVPAIVMGQAPNLNGVSWGGYPGWEEFNGVIRGIQMYSGLLSLADIQAEINTPQSTAAGQNLIWYLNPNPTPADVTDKSGKGHHPSWDGSGRPTLYVGP